MNSRQRRRLRRLSERMFKLCDLTRLRIAQDDLDKFCSICTEAARRDSDKGGSPLPEHMLKENGERPTGRDSIMAHLVVCLSEILLSCVKSGSACVDPGGSQGWPDPPKEAKEAKQ